MLACLGNSGPFKPAFASAPWAAQPATHPIHHAITSIATRGKTEALPRPSRYHREECGCQASSPDRIHERGGMGVFPTEPTESIAAYLACLDSFQSIIHQRLRRGSTEERIARFASLAKHPLPLLYVEYLRHFGGGNSFPRIALDGSSALSRSSASMRERSRKHRIGFQRTR